MTRILYHADALKWLPQQGQFKGTSIITSLPDLSEFGELSLGEWKLWFTKAAQLVLMSCPPDGICIFYQSDIKRDGIWIDKSFLCQKAAELTGHELIAHKVVCRAPAGTATFGRTGYSHLLCFSQNLKPEIANSSSDVLPDAGPTTWTRGMGINACLTACEFIRAHSNSHTILDPFCGHGAVLAVANELGFNAIGVDHSLKCIRKAEAMRWGQRPPLRNLHEEIMKNRADDRQNQSTDDGRAPTVDFEIVE